MHICNECKQTRYDSGDKTKIRYFNYPTKNFQRWTYGVLYFSKYMVSESKMCTKCTPVLMYKYVMLVNLLVKLGVKEL